LAKNPSDVGFCSQLYCLLGSCDRREGSVALLWVEMSLFRCDVTDKEAYH
jgi:hypothetical protein